MRTDIAVVGGGVLGITTAYWLRLTRDCDVTLIEKGPEVAAETTRRNTGVIHRPYYLDPVKRALFARTAGRSYAMWKRLASRYALPWVERGTLMVAPEEAQMKEVEEYGRWASDNGMEKDEYEILDAAGSKRVEPEVRCAGAFLSKTDTSTDFASLSREVWQLAEAEGARLLRSSEVAGAVRTKDGLELRLNGGGVVECGVMVNAAGGSSLDLAHAAGLAREYTDLHFRGEYWEVDADAGPAVRRNVYSVARHSGFNFLDPHFIIRPDGRREVGPNAVLVPGPDTYEGSGGVAGMIGMILERPIGPKFRLFADPTFLSLVADEWMSSLSKKAMCGRVKKFIPALDPGMLTRRGLAGVRSSLIGDEGFVPEALTPSDDRSLHVLNFNSPGATGAPAFSEHLVGLMEERGLLDGFPARPREGVWGRADARGSR
jgi:(S)-2-hydroxyglutarate dehydrogenase